MTSYSSVQNTKSFPICEGFEACGGPQMLIQDEAIFIIGPK